MNVVLAQTHPVVMIETAVEAEAATAVEAAAVVDEEVIEGNEEMIVAHHRGTMVVDEEDVVGLAVTVATAVITHVTTSYHHR